MKKILLLITFLCVWMSTNGIAQVITCAEARSKAPGTTVTVKGIVTHDGELGPIRYFQDNTGGIAAYPSATNQPNFTTEVNSGVEVQITGVLKDFSGLLEIDPINTYAVVSSGNPVPDPEVISPSGLIEAREGKLIKIIDAVFKDAGGTFAGGKSYLFNVGTQSSTVFIRNGHPLAGKLIPTVPVALVGICSQFNTNYQVLPRTVADIQPSVPFYISSLPKQSNVTQGGFTVSWKTNLNGSTILHYGPNIFMSLTANSAQTGVDHDVTLTGLNPGTLYYVQAESVNGTNSAKSPIYTMMTASTSTGEVKVYFNQHFDPSFSTGKVPLGGNYQSVVNAIISAINGATTSIDVAQLNCDQDLIVDALVAAKNKGVRVRYIADDGTSNTALQGTLPFNVIFVNTSNLMHNKFMVIDAASVDKSWVMTGSMNWTKNNIQVDYNNVVFVQDKSLAKAYELEFEEMWGSTTATPNIANSKAGSGKTDNTPHLFSVGGHRMECYFTPGDGSENALAAAINTSTSSLEFAIFSFTLNSVGTAVKDADKGGAKVRGIIENINDTGGEYTFLLGQGVDVRPHTADTLVHHKYAIINEQSADASSAVATGSYNWSSSAQNSNDENILLMWHPEVANMFRQEFEARWATTVSGLPFVPGLEGVEVLLVPNPVINSTTVNITSDKSQELRYFIRNLDGKVVSQVQSWKVEGTSSHSLDVSNLSSGSYVIYFMNDQGIMSRKFIKI